MILTIFSKDMTVNKRETSRRHCISTTAIEEKEIHFLYLTKTKTAPCEEEPWEIFFRFSGMFAI